MAEFERDLQDIKEEVRSRIDIVEIIGQYTQLKRTGKNWTGLCPFHADRKPSFAVMPQFQGYKCWSCGESGDVFTFVMKKENLDFIEALESLAKRAGVPFERSFKNKELQSEREQALELNRLATQYFQDRLSKSQEARDYLAGRAILKSSQEQWDIGFAPQDWEGLTFHLERQRADMRLAAKIGLIKIRKEGNGGYYDTFRNRLMFPIHDMQGSVIAFGGRAMSADDPAKYLNSEASIIFDKSRTLYGLLYARKKISPSVPAVFVEGYVDVITTHQAGFSQCVATLGTSMTEEHARTLIRYSPKVIICYDSDSAGIKATMRGAGVWESAGVEGAEVRVARLPAGEDPDSLLRKGDTAGFQLALDNAVPRVEFQLEMAMSRHDTSTEEGKSDALAEVVPILASISSLTQRDFYLQRVAILHPGYRYNISRAMDSLSGDIIAYKRQQKNRPSPRDQAFPLTESANGQPLANPPGFPAFRQDTKNTQPKPAYKPGNPNPVWKEVDGKWQKTKPEDRGMIDQSPPSLLTPQVSGVERSERQLLRGLFSADWRSAILARIQPEEMATDLGQRLFALISRTPAGEDGSIDPLRLLNIISMENRDQSLEADERTPGLKEGGENPPPTPLDNETESEAPSDSEEVDPFLQSSEIIDFDGSKPPALQPPGQISGENKGARRNSAKLTEFIHEVLEESVSFVTKEPLNEAVIADCIKRLRRHRSDIARRELEALSRRDDLSPVEQTAYLKQYHLQMRKARGSQLAEESD